MDEGGGLRHLLSFTFTFTLLASPVEEILSAFSLRKNLFTNIKSFIWPRAVMVTRGGGLPFSDKITYDKKLELGLFTTCCDVAILHSTGTRRIRRGKLAGTQIWGFRLKLTKAKYWLLDLDNLDPEHVKHHLNLRINILTNAPERKFTVRMFFILLFGY